MLVMQEIHIETQKKTSTEAPEKGFLKMLVFRVKTY